MTQTVRRINPDEAVQDLNAKRPLKDIQKREPMNEAEAEALSHVQRTLNKADKGEPIEPPKGFGPEGD